MSDSSFDLDAFLALPRLSGLAASPGGDRLVAATALPDGERFSGTLWELDAGGGPPRRLTDDDATAPVFAADGSLLFCRKRADDDAKGLWRLPPSGDAHPLAGPAGGVDTVVTARAAPTVVARVRMHPGTATFDEDAERERARGDTGVTAQLHAAYPIRYWDHWLGPRECRLVAADVGDGEPQWRNLVSDAGPALEDAAFDLTPDGATVVTTWWAEADDPRERVKALAMIDVATGELAVVAHHHRASLDAPAVSPDGRRVACIASPLGAPDDPPDRSLWILELAGGEAYDALPGFDRWPESPVWTHDGGGVLFVADDEGHRSLYRLDVASGQVTRLAHEGAYETPVPAADGTLVYALRSHVGALPVVVSLDPSAADQQPRELRCPGGESRPPGRVERVAARAADGAEIPAWLVLPPDADGRAPLAVFVHGGPLSSWNSWHWRWNPHVLAARGWAVLLPDPGLSTGYGMGFVRRGWGRWGAEPYTDVMAVVESVAARGDVDGDHAALLGGSFGGYMANWVAGQTDRFKAIVTHASLWNLEAFHGTTDLGPWWEHQFGDRYTDPARYREWSPHQHVGRIRTPMLVIHGERDFRVPYGEALGLVTDLARHGSPVAYLHFPDEHHWIMKPGHVRVWYETVLAFLGHHVLGEPWRRPDLL